MTAFFEYPKAAAFGRVLPKNKIYGHAQASTRLKQLFVDEVDQIVWKYKLAPETINLSATKSVTVDLGLHSGQSLSAILSLTWKDVRAIGLPRSKWSVSIQGLRNGYRREIPITRSLEGILKRCKIALPHWPREYVIRLEDGRGLSVMEFNALWRLYMNRWASPNNRFSFSDIRTKALADRQSALKKPRRQGH